MERGIGLRKTSRPAFITGKTRRDYVCEFSKIKSQEAQRAHKRSHKTAPRNKKRTKGHMPDSAPIKPNKPRKITDLPKHLGILEEKL